MGNHVMPPTVIKQMSKEEADALDAVLQEASANGGAEAKEHVAALTKNFNDKVNGKAKRKAGIKDHQVGVYVPQPEPLRVRCAQRAARCRQWWIANCCCWYFWFVEVFGCDEAASVTDHDLEFAGEMAAWPNDADGPETMELQGDEALDPSQPLPTQQYTKELPSNV